MRTHVHELHVRLQEPRCPERRGQVPHAPCQLAHGLQLQDSRNCGTAYSERQVATLGLP